ncbi:ATP-binding cassette domain-containing protein [Streptomyces inhibens]|uniref:ATP-binding cassette domain-containing protein n=1 Tax=Streptomyces inhibens TaxID=2293571 RepID=UPI00402A9126
MIRATADAVAQSAAARAAGVDTVLAGLPHGLDTLLATSFWGGHDLSGGQWQRFAVARAFYREASVLVLDEPTSAMDPRAEHQVISRFKTLATGCIALFVTHNLTNTRIADRIIVLNQGRIEDEGTFDELLHRGGLFAELYRLSQDRWAGRTDHVGPATPRALPGDHEHRMSMSMRSWALVTLSSDDDRDACPPPRGITPAARARTARRPCAAQRGRAGWRRSRRRSRQPSAPSG